MLESSDSKQLIVAKEDLYTLLDAMSTFTKHENQVEMKSTLGELPCSFIQEYLLTVVC